MFISQAVGYALHGLISLSSCPSGERTYAADIAHSIGASESYLAKILQALARAGLVASVRGMKGGYALGRPVDQITVRQVIEVVEGPVNLAPCILGSQTERDCVACPVLTVMRKAYHRMLEELDAMTIEELARSVFPRKVLASHGGAALVSVPAGGSAESADVA